MNSDFFTDLAIEAVAREIFSRKIEVSRSIVRDIRVGPSAHASVFYAKGGGVYMLIRATSDLVLGDIIKIARGVGVDVADFLPPGGVATYFDDKALEHFRKLFPAKPLSKDDDDLRHYRTLVPYAPALLKISRISGEVREYEPVKREWQVAKRMTYARVEG